MNQAKAFFPLAGEVSVYERERIASKPSDRFRRLKHATRRGETAYPARLRETASGIPVTRQKLLLMQTGMPKPDTLSSKHPKTATS